LFFGPSTSHIHCDDDHGHPQELQSETEIEINTNQNSKNSIKKDRIFGSIPKGKELMKYLKTENIYLIQHRIQAIL